MLQVNTLPAVLSISPVSFTRPLSQHRDCQPKIRCRLSLRKDGRCDGTMSLSDGPQMTAVPGLPASGVCAVTHVQRGVEMAELVLRSGWHISCTVAATGSFLGIFPVGRYTSVQDEESQDSSGE